MRFYPNVRKRACTLRSNSDAQLSSRLHFMQDIILSYYLDIMENEEVIQEKVLGQALGLAAVKTYSAAVASAASATDAVILGRIGY